MVWVSSVGNVDESEVSDVTTVGSNVRKDLNEFQEKHATLVLTTVKVNWIHLFNFFFKKLDPLCGEIALCCSFSVCFLSLK